MKKYIIAMALMAVTVTFAVLIIDLNVKTAGARYVVDHEECPRAQAAIVLGAYVFPDGRLCDMLADRVMTAVELYHASKVEKIIMSGDHGRKSYDEVNNMRLFAEKMGVPTKDIFMDHAGFSTYDSMYRAGAIFQVGSAVVITQAFHLPRAVYTARALGVEAVGVEADRHLYADAGYYEMREIPARVKAFIQVNLRSKPKFHGEAIPVTGDGRLTHDRPATEL